MKKLLKFLIEKITDDSNDIEINETINENGSYSYEILAPQEKIGGLVGKSGRIISAIRTIMRITAIKENAFLSSINIKEKQ